MESTAKGLCRVDSQFDRLDAWQTTRRSAAPTDGSQARACFQRQGRSVSPATVPTERTLCKHLAAVLYGVGHRLDSEPDLFFRLRGVNQQDLITEALSAQSVDTALGLDQESAIDSGDLESIFGIDLATSCQAPKPSTEKEGNEEAFHKGEEEESHEETLWKVDEDSSDKSDEKEKREENSDTCQGEHRPEESRGCGEETSSEWIEDKEKKGEKQEEESRQCVGRCLSSRHRSSRVAPLPTGQKN